MLDKVIAVKWKLHNNVTVSSHIQMVLTGSKHRNDCIHSQTIEFTAASSVRFALYMYTQLTKRGETNRNITSYVGY